MSAFKKRKLSGNVPLPGAAPPKVRSASSKPASKKPPVKHAPQPEPESSEEDEVAEEEDQEEDESATNGNNAVRSLSPEEREFSKAAADEPKKTFADLGVREELCDACENLKFTTPTPIQREAVPLALEGRDVIGLAETGSGKTAAFVLPILQSLLEKPQALFGLIMAPTRELAYQIAQQVDALGSIINVKCATLVGGMDMVPQAIALSKRPHIVVATPGMSHISYTIAISD